jgi:hypothetical protein
MKGNEHRDGVRNRCRVYEKGEWVAPLPSFNRYCFGHATFSFGRLFGTLLFPLLVAFSVPIVTR